MPIKIIMIKEGKIKLNIETPGKISKKLEVFYNPMMKLNRDISISVIKNYAKTSNPLRVALPLSGSGIRGLRFLAEIPDLIKEIHFNDVSKDAISCLMENLQTNDLFDYTKVYLSKKEAQNFLFESKGFDYIDVDPFGTPNPFLDAACQRLSRGGILAITATDTAPLSGTYPKVCLRHYDARPLRNHLKHFVALRILIRKIQLVGAQYEKALYPIYSYSKHHYLRVFLRCVKSKSQVNELLDKHEYLLYCPSCMDYHFSEDNSAVCDCGKKMLYSGKMYSGQLWEQDFSENINLIKHISEESSFSGRYYSLPRLASSLKTSVPSYNSFFRKIKEHGNISRTHISDDLFKTDVPVETLRRIVSGR